MEMVWKFFSAVALVRAVALSNRRAQKQHRLLCRHCNPPHNRIVHCSHSPPLHRRAAIIAPPPPPLEAKLLLLPAPSPASTSSVSRPSPANSFATILQNNKRGRSCPSPHPLACHRCAAGWRSRPTGATASKAVRSTGIARGSWQRGRRGGQRRGRGPWHTYILKGRSCRYCLLLKSQSGSNTS